MITVTCQHTGFSFEAQTARSKNHPLVAEFLNDAAGDNRHYRGASRIAKQLVRDASGYDSIDDLMNDVRSAYVDWQQTGEAKKVRKSHAEATLAGKKRIAAWQRDSRQYEGENGAW